MTNPKSKQGITLAALRTAEVESALAHTEGTRQRIANETGMPLANIGKHLARLQKSGQAHILKWTPFLPFMPIFVLGPGQDAPKPSPLTATERHSRAMARQRERRMIDRDEVVSGRMHALTLATIERAKAAPCHWFSSLEAA